MRKHVTFVAAALLLAAAPSEASVQARTVVGWLGAGDWQLREYEGEAYLAKAPFEPGAQVRHPWSVSNPTVKARGGRLLGYATKGGGPQVRLVGKGEEGASSRWSFEVVSHIRPGCAKADPKLKEGTSGLTFRVRAAEGPFKGWYLATEANKGRTRRLVLVRAKKDAAVFKYIEEYHYVVGCEPAGWPR